MKLLGRLAVLLVVAAVAVRLAMPAMARCLIRTDPLARSDAIIVLGSLRLERTLEAGSLYREGWSRKIILLRAPDVGNNGTLRRLNIRVPLWLDVQKSALAQMSVPPDAIIPAPEVEDTTKHEADLIGDFIRRAGFKRIIIVTSPYHTGRAGRLFRKAAGNSFAVIMRADRYERVDPDHWWRHALDRNDVVFEWLKNIHALTFSDD
ncbi:MAG TPA: YdcF family protein [Thermoanaerobaculia bacterium]|nr:YdcF family protein [Thermoanaerobaculia bacterium]